jgi:hypothetical protein
MGMVFFTKTLFGRGMKGTLHQHNYGWVIKDKNQNEYEVSFSQINVNEIKKFKVGRLVDFELKDNKAFIKWS